MIEGYEKLKEELLQDDGKLAAVEEHGRGRAGGHARGRGAAGPLQNMAEKQAVKDMIETWLNALYKIYDELSEEAFEGGEYKGRNDEVDGRNLNGRGGWDERSVSVYSEYDECGYVSE